MPPLALAACLLALLGGSSATTIHVAPERAGPDSGRIATADGSASRPFATLGAAHEAARTLLAAGPLTEDLTVSCAAGTYELAEPLVFTERDGGRDGHRVIWSGPADGVGEARVLGGTRLGGWELAWGEVYRMRLGRRVYGLSENGKQANPARHPNTSPGEGSGWLEASVTNHGMTVSAGSLPPNVSHFGLGNASVRMAAGTNYYWSEDWAIDSFSLSATGAGTATFRQDQAKIASKMQAGPHCVAYGSAGFLDEPGEFALDSQGEWLFYWPRSGLPIESLEIVAPTSQRPVSVVGASFVDGKVTTGLSLRGLSFVGSDGTDSWYLFDQRMSNSVPEGQQQGLIFMENATDIEVIDCKILSATVSGIWLNKAVSGVVIRGNWIEDAGHCAVFMYGWWPGAVDSYIKGPNTTSMDTYVNRNNTVDSNLIHNVGTMNMGAAGVWIFQSGENHITRNIIRRGPRNAVGLFGPHFVAMSTANYTEFRTAEATAAMKALKPFNLDTGLYDIPTFGFNSGFKAMHARNNTVARNEFSLLVRDSCDPGLVESYGIGKGLLVMENAIHDVTIPPKRWGTPSEALTNEVQILFSDAGTHFSNYSGNVLYELSMCGGGHGAMVKNWQETFENNVFADSSMAATVWVGSYAGPVSDMILRRNVAWNATGYCNLTGNSHLAIWPGPLDAVPPPGSPPGEFEPSGHIAAGDKNWGTGAGSNANTTCYHQSCNGWNPGKCAVEGACTYRLSPAEMARPMIQELDYNLDDLPILPSFEKDYGFQSHSVHADPGFVRQNKPWETNWTDFVATSAAAKAVGHVPPDMAAIGLGAAFKFDRALIGRRRLFREGAPGSRAGAPKQHFEDQDRLRGLVMTASTGLLAAAVPVIGGCVIGGWPAAPGAWAVYKNRVFNTGGATTATIVARANVAGLCGDGSAGGNCPPAAAGAATQPHRFWRVSTVPTDFDQTSGMNPTWDVCSLDFFGSADGSGPSLLPVNKASDPAGGTFFASPAGNFPAEPFCNRGNTSTWGRIWKSTTKAEHYLGWDYGAGKSAAVKSIKIKQFDTQYCAKNLTVQWSDDGSCFHDSWYVNASANCPFNTTAVGGHAGITTSPPAVQPKPAAPKHDIGDAALNITFTLDAPRMGGGTVIGTLQLADKGVLVTGEGRSAGDGNAPGWCDYEGELELPKDGATHDLYANFDAGSDASFVLDHFTLSTK